MIRFLILCITFYSLEGQSKEKTNYSPFIETMQLLNNDYKQALRYIDMLEIFAKDMNASFGLGLKIENKNKYVLEIDGLAKTKYKFTDGIIDVQQIFKLLDKVRPSIEQIVKEKGLEIDYVEFLCDHLISSVDSRAWLTSQAAYDQYLSNGTDLGISFSKDSLGTFTIQSVKKNFAADLVGLKKGDRVTEINSIPTKYLGGGAFLKLSSGQAGTSLTVTIERNGKVTTHKIVLKDTTPGEPDYKIELLSDSLLSVTLHHISEGVTNKISGVLVANNSITNVILDLQDCQGELFNEAIEFVNLFIDKNDTIISITHKKKYNTTVYTGTNTKPFKDCNVIILTNEGTSSGAEIIAAALQNNKRAKVLGTNTGGIGSVQSDFTFESLILYRGKITTSEILTPSGMSITKKGVTPDIYLNETSDLLKYAIEHLN